MTSQQDIRADHKGGNQSHSSFFCPSLRIKMKGKKSHYQKELANTCLYLEMYIEYLNIMLILKENFIKQ